MKMDMLRFSGGENVDFPLIGEGVSGPYILKSVDGLGPPEVNVRVAETRHDFGIYQGKKAANRSVVALIGLNPDWDTGQRPDNLRTELYTLLTPRYEGYVRADVMHDGVSQAYMLGQIERMETALFTKDPAVQLTLKCVHPYLYHPVDVLASPSRYTEGGAQVFQINNIGSGPAGFRMAITMKAAAGPSITVGDTDPRGQKMIINGVTWADGDRLLIDTRAGARGVWKAVAGGGFVSILNNLDRQNSEWMSLYYGMNAIRVTVPAFDWDPETQFRYRPTYWGV